MEYCDSDEDDKPSIQSLDSLFNSLIGHHNDSIFINPYGLSSELHRGFIRRNDILEKDLPGATALPNPLPRPLPRLINRGGTIRGCRKSKHGLFRDPFSSSDRDSDENFPRLNDDLDLPDSTSSLVDQTRREERHRVFRFPFTEKSRRRRIAPFIPEGHHARHGVIFAEDKTGSSSDTDDDFVSSLRKASLQGRVNHRRNKKSTWSTDIEGNVKVSEICHDSVTGTCKYEDIGCRRLHAHQHYYWQFSNQDGQWFNLPLSWVNSLESKYTDPAQEQVSLPKMDEGYGDGKIRQLLTLKRQDHWTANLQLMILVNSDWSKMYSLRRLCTEKIPGRDIKSSNFLWYFLDQNSKWVEYGKADTSGIKHMVSSITSSQIESHFLSKPNVPMTFRASQFTYVLDIEKMIQMNMNTGVIRKVRRRPEADKNQSSETPNYFSFRLAKNDMNLPSSWDAMKPKQRACRVTLQSSSAEYQKVVGVLNGEISPDSISKIERIQNPCLWRAFQNKVDDMTLTYGDVSNVNIRQLFHGTRLTVVDNIINENFDWRLHGTSRGQVHGQGTYFSTKASESYRYCKPDDQGNKYIFIARVAVGTITKGDATMIRPPINPATNAPYDSTGSGSIIVKYDKQEYYPEYILTLDA